MMLHHNTVLEPPALASRPGFDLPVSKSGSSIMYAGGANRLAVGRPYGTQSLSPPPILVSVARDEAPVMGDVSLSSAGFEIDDRREAAAAAGADVLVTGPVSRHGRHHYLSNGRRQFR